MTEAPARKYALTRIRAGDYIFPSNDISSLWRVYRYEEDGSLEGWQGMFWACARFDGTLDQADALLQRDPDKFLSWADWLFHSGPFRSRREALREAMHAQRTAAMREP